MNSEQKQNKAVGVSVSDLSHAFGEQQVLKSIAFEVQPGELFVIMGPSGSGKSVLLRLIIGLLNPQQGKILIDHIPSNVQSNRQPWVRAMVFQSGALFHSLNVYDNLAFYPREQNLMEESSLHEKVLKILTLLGIENAAFKYPSELSGGMQKRVAIARALMMEPQLLLYDEPTSELDPITSALISEIIGTLKQAFQVTSIIVSHDRDLALGIADRIALLNEGRLELISTPEEIKKSEWPLVKHFFSPKISLTQPSFRS